MDNELLRFQRLYKNVAMADFDDDYASYKIIRRLLLSYYKNPSKGKIHAIYNKLVVLRRVFPETFIYHEIMKIAPNMYTRNLVAFIINEMFMTTTRIDILDDCWVDHVEELVKDKLIKVLID
jgi:hypothetical protein